MHIMKRRQGMQIGQGLQSEQGLQNTPGTMSVRGKRSLRGELRRLGRTLTRCVVCGFAEVRTDLVFHRGVLLLHECPHCEHRWTNSAEAAAAVASRRLREVSTAA